MTHEQTIDYALDEARFHIALHRLRRALGCSEWVVFEKGRYAEAPEVNRRAIGHDGYLEEARWGLMRCQAALGERGQALKHYRALVELLNEALGTASAAETRALYEGLRSDEGV